MANFFNMGRVCPITTGGMAARLLGTTSSSSWLMGNQCKIWFIVLCPPNHQRCLCACPWAACSKKHGVNVFVGRLSVNVVAVVLELARPRNAAPPQAPGPAWCIKCGKTTNPDCVGPACVTCCQDRACTVHWECLPDCSYVPDNVFIDRVHIPYIHVCIDAHWHILIYPYTHRCFIY